MVILMANKKNASIKDVARLSGVSVATVSRIMNDTGRYSPKTRDKVLKVIEEIGYERNSLATSLRINKSNMIGILVPDIANEFYASVLKKSEQALFKLGYSTIICNTERSIERETAYYRMLIEHRVDGLISVSSASNQMPLSAKYAIPIVFIDRDPHSNSELIVTTNHYAAGKELAKLLLNQADDLCLVMTKSRPSSTMDRVQAFKDELAKSKMDTSGRILSLNTTSDKFLQPHPDLKEFIEKKCHKGKRLGVFAINDNVAYMVLRVADELGLKVPDELIVTGFDGMSIASISQPTITTIVQDSTAIADEASRLLVESIKKRGEKERLSGTIYIPYRLAQRKSTLPKK
ncbi:LacI family transcriptional regulator [Lacticaseibacillus rhamnosus]|nr:LacI family transcriptional regulator [Lacticaseibacillus rhamnosus]RXS51668.1 LacI family transcriptional regulator [Lacticaseibacillus rhamnosus]TLQ22137.1 LacI family transcriptional regulator [Lacticaseibacillus rhamnosus]